MIREFNLNGVHSTWVSCIQEALTRMDSSYLHQLSVSDNWLPGSEKIFSAFSIPLNEVKYVLFGESPYPRVDSANGYAFWDADVTEIWSEKGLSKAVNRATSLRNIIKMLLVAEGSLKVTETTPEAIQRIDKSRLVQTNQEFFSNFLNHGFLLLNASLVLQETNVKLDAAAWNPFLKQVLTFFLQKNPKAKFILLGKIANTIDRLIEKNHVEKLYAEHPYNLSFISNKKILEFFQPLHLLKKRT